MPKYTYRDFRNGPIRTLAHLEEITSVGAVVQHRLADAAAGLR